MTTPARVMIVDDNARMRATTRAILAHGAVVVVECENGQEAVDMYVEAHPTLVLMDIAMPVMDGITAAQRIRALDPAANIVMVTELSDDALRSSATKAGASAYITKDDLLRVLEFMPPCVNS